MRLESPFYRLPLQFDADRLLWEARQFPDVVWRPDRFSIEGYTSLNLVSFEGRNTEFQSTPMRPSAALQTCPYVRQVLSALGSTFSEVRFRRLEGAREIPEHSDTNYFWFSRFRLHVPVITDPSVRFIVEDREVNMRAGECWLFDRLRNHRVINASPSERIHLIMDTGGSQHLWDLMMRAHRPFGVQDGETPAFQPFASDEDATVQTDLQPTPGILPPEHVQLFVEDLLYRLDTAGGAPAHWREQVVHALTELVWSWRGLWSQYGPAPEGWSRYQAVMDRIDARCVALDRAPEAAGAKLRLKLSNRLALFFESGAFGAAHLPATLSESIRSPEQVRLTLSDSLLLRVKPGGLLALDERLTERFELDPTEFLLLTRIASGLGASAAADAVGVEEDESLWELLEQWISAGLLRPERVPWKGAAVTEHGLTGTAAPPDKAPHSKHVPSTARVRPLREVFVRMLEHGPVGVWVGHEKSFRGIDPLGVSLLAAIGDGRILEEALAEIGLAHDAGVDQLLCALQDAGVLEISGEDL